MTVTFYYYICKCLYWVCNLLNAELNPICHLLALLGGHHIFHVSRIRVNSLLLLLLEDCDRPPKYAGEEPYNFVYFVQKFGFILRKSCLIGNPDRL